MPIKVRENGIYNSKEFIKALKAPKALRASRNMILFKVVVKYIHSFQPFPSIWRPNSKVRRGNVMLVTRCWSSTPPFLLWLFNTLFFGVFVI